MHSRALATAALAVGIAASAAPAQAGWTLAPLDGNSLGSMYPLAIDDGADVTAQLNPSDHHPTLYAYATTSSLTTLSLCGGGSTQPSAVDVTGFYNVGSCFPANGGSITGYLYVVGGSTSAVAYPGAGSTFPRGVINGTVAGTYFVQNVGHGFLYHAASNGYSSFDPPGSIDTEVEGMGPGGTVFGYYAGLGALYDQGFLYRNGSYTFLSASGYLETFPMAVNGSDQVAGLVVDTAGHAHAFSWKNGIFTVLHPPHEQDSYGFAITADGRLTGTVRTLANKVYGFVWSPALDRISYFNPPVGTLSMQVRGINDWGQVTGYYTSAIGQTAFVGTCTGARCVP